MPNYDITFCMRHCANFKCHRNRCHLRAVEEWRPISMAEFTDCKKYIELKEEKKWREQKEEG